MTTSSNLAEETIAPDEAALTAEFISFLKEASAKRHPSGTMPRFNQGRAAGCVDAELTVPPGLPAELQVGLFARPRTYRARIRFASAASESDREKDVRGMSIQVADVNQTGENLTPGETTQDFMHAEGLPGGVALEHRRVPISEQLGLERRGHLLADFARSGPHVTQVHRLSVPVGAERLAAEIDVDPAGQGERDHQHRGREVVGPHWRGVPGPQNSGCRSAPRRRPDGVRPPAAR